MIVLRDGDWPSTTLNVSVNAPAGRHVITVQYTPGIIDVILVTIHSPRLVNQPLCGNLTTATPGELLRMLERRGWPY